MARTVRDARLESWESRSKLPVRERHYRDIGDGIALVYRRGGGKRGSGTWSVRIRMDDGRYVLRSLGVSDDHLPADGERVLTYRQATTKALELAARGPASSYTVGNAVDDYLEWFRNEKKSVKATEATIKAHIRPMFGDRPVDDLTSNEVKAWLSKLARAKARTRSGIGMDQRHKAERKTTDEQEEAKRARRATANRILAVLRAILNKAFQDGRARDDRAWRRVKPFPHVDLPRVRYLTTSDAGRLVNACDADFRPLVRAALLTGARYGELARMTVGNFNEATAQVFMAPSKSGKPRYVPLNVAGVALFKLKATGRRATALMFTRGDGEAWGKNHQQRPMFEACKRAELTPTLRFHELRHTYASTLAQAGADLLTISKLLGHADTRVTARHYAHLCDETLANAVNAHLPDFGEAEETNVAALA